MPLPTRRWSRGTPDSGNFLTTTRPQAVQYLKGIFRWRPEVSKYTTKSALNEVAAEAGKRSGSSWIRFAQKGRTQKGILGARLQEALLLVGVPEAAKLMRQAQKNALAHAKKLEAKKAKADAAKAKRAATTKAKLEKDFEKLAARAAKSAETYTQKQAELSDKISKLGQVAVSARRARAKAKARARKKMRRNPVTRRRAKRMKRAKKAKRSKRSARKSKRMKRAKKAKRSKRSRKAKRSRRKR